MTNPKNDSELKAQTLAIHKGEVPDLDHPSAIPDITMSNTFLVSQDTPFSAENLDMDSPHAYTRWSNPTIEILEKKVAALEGGEAALAFSSGIAAVTGLMMQKVRSGDRVIVSDISYAGVREFGNDILSGLGVEVIPVNLSRLNELEEACKKPVKLIFAESPCNPILRLTDIRAVASVARNAGAQLAVDSTFATPCATHPLEMGADYVIHSITKYMGGHGDAMGGIVVGRKDNISQLKQRIRVHTGAIISPFNAWLINRGIATLSLRMKAHSASAEKLARYLEGHKVIEQVVYPGLPSHPQYELAREQMSMFSGMLTFRTRDPQKLIDRIIDKCTIFHYAVSLGHHKSLIFYLPTDEMQKSTFKLDSRQLEDYRRFAGDGIFRVSVGLEDPDDLISDLEHAL